MFNEIKCETCKLISIRLNATQKICVYARYVQISHFGSFDSHKIKFVMGLPDFLIGGGFL